MLLQRRGIIGERCFRSSPEAGKRRVRRDHAEQAQGFLRCVGRRDQAFQDQAQRAEGRAQWNAGEERLDLFGRLVLGPGSKCRVRGLGEFCPAGIARLGDLGRDGEGERRGQFGKACCLGRFGGGAAALLRDPCGFLVLALADQAVEIEHRLAHHSFRREGVFKNNGGFLEHALVGQSAGASGVGVGEALAPFWPRFLAGQLLEGLDRVLEAAEPHELGATLGEFSPRGQRWRPMYGLGHRNASATWKLGNAVGRLRLEFA